MRKRIIWTQAELKYLKENVNPTERYVFNRISKPCIDWYQVASKVNKKFHNDRSNLSCQSKYYTEFTKRKRL